MSKEIKYYFRISSLSHTEFCVKRSKLEIFNNLAKIIPTNPKSSIITGNRLHYEYSYGLKDFDRMVIRYRLDKFMVSSENRRRCFEKKIGNNVIIRGLYDDLRCLTYKDKKYTSLIEVKTTSKKYIWRREILAAVRQLELYMWMLKDILETIGYPLWKRSYLEVYSQKTGYLIKRIPVEYNDKIEEWILDVIDKFNGISRMEVPPKSYCKLCPNIVKRECSWYKVQFPKKAEEIENKYGGVRY